VDAGVIRSFDKDHDVIYIRYTTGVPLMSDRDFVYLENRKQLEDGVRLIVGYSVEVCIVTYTIIMIYKVDEAPPKSECVRGTVHFSVCIYNTVTNVQGMGVKTRQRTEYYRMYVRTTD
jgi:hypothetical protein